MNVTVQEKDKLKRKLTVEVPLEEVKSAYEEVYSRLRSNLRVNGFRQGRYPRRLAEKRFKSLMAGEAMQTLVPKYFDRAVGELELRPATEPQFDNLDIDQARPFKFDVEFEVFPTFELPAPSDFKLEKKVIKVTSKEVNERIEEMRKARASLEDNGNEPAEVEDVVSFDFHGTIGGEPFEGGSAENQRIEVGGGQYLPDFDAQFVGIRAGQSKTFQVTFPEDYGDASVTGKTVSFQVTAHRVERKVLPELEKDFFARFGKLESLTEFKAQVKSEFEAEKEREAGRERQNSLSEQIRGKFDFEVPERLVEQSLREFEHELSHNDPEAFKDEKRLAELKQEQAEKTRANLRLAYVIDALARAGDIKAEEEEVRQRFHMQAYMMRQNPADLVNEPAGRRMSMQIEQNLVTGKTLDHLADQVLSRASESGDSAGTAKSGESGTGKSTERKSGPPEAGRSKAGAAAGKSKREPGD